MNRKLNCAVLLAVMAVGGIVSTSSGQSLWTDQSSDRGVSFEFVRPQFSGDKKPDFLTSVAYLAGRFSIGKNASAEIELPFARYSFSSDYGDVSEAAVGNPYLGARINGKNVITRIGLRLPAASSSNGSALSVGALSDYDRFEAFLPDVLTAYTSVMGRARVSDQISVNVGAGPLVSVYTRDTEGDKAEIFAQYVLLAEFKADAVTVQGGFTGRAIVTEDELSFGDRSVHQLGIGATKSSGALRPGAHVRVPLDDDLSELVNFVVDIHFTVVVQ